MINLKAWRTDIKFKFPRVHILKGKHYDNAAEEIVKQVLKVTFWLGAWKAVELIQAATKLIKGLAG